MVIPLEYFQIARFDAHGCHYYYRDARFPDITFIVDIRNRASQSITDMHHREAYDFAVSAFQRHIKPIINPQNESFDWNDLLTVCSLPGKATCIMASMYSLHTMLKTVLVDETL